MFIVCVSDQNIFQIKKCFTKRHMDNVLLFLKIIKMKRNTILFILKTFHIFDNWPRLTACSLYGKLISSNRFTHVLSNYQMANKIIYIKEPIFQRLNKVEKIQFINLGKIKSIERRNEKFLKSSTFLLLFPKTKVLRFTYET